MTNKRRLSAIEEKVAARRTRPLGTDEALKTAQIWKSLNDRLRKQSAKNYRLSAKKWRFLMCAQVIALVCAQ